MIDGELVLLRRLPAMRRGWFMGDDAMVYRWEESQHKDPCQNLVPG